jgi:hypothetical protein
VAPSREVGKAKGKANKLNNRSWERVLSKLGELTQNQG